MTRRTWLAVGVVVVAVGGMVLARAVPRRPSAVAASLTPEVKAGATMIAGPGRVEPLSEEVEVSAEMSGKLVEVRVDEGDRVTHGQVLARLEPRDFEARLAAARARVAVAEAERLRLVNGSRLEERREAAAVASQAGATLDHAVVEMERSRRLFAEGVIARETLDRSERDWRVAVARESETAEREKVVDGAARADELARADATLQLARANRDEAAALLAKTVIRAPIDGVILRRHRQAGESVSLEGAAPAVVTVADTRVLRVRVDVDERDVAQLAVGQPAWVTADAFPGRRFTGRVVSVGRMLGPKRVRTDAPSERVDTKILETIIELTDGSDLPVGLRVDAYIEAPAAGARPR